MLRCFISPTPSWWMTQWHSMNLFNVSWFMTRSSISHQFRPQEVKSSSDQRKRSLWSWFSFFGSEPSGCSSIVGAKSECWSRILRSSKRTFGRAVHWPAWIPSLSIGECRWHHSQAFSADLRGTQTQSAWVEVRNGVTCELHPRGSIQLSFTLPSSLQCILLIPGHV